jgi:DNA-binding transcriptional regulator YiaG
MTHVHSTQLAMPDNSVTRTLARAARTVGGAERLAEYLDVEDSELQDWLDGRREPPASIYVRALDLVARGPFAAAQRKKKY